ncbi:MAG TPA: CPBP family intramembrane metalloprotease [Parvularculaceae bacterium]|nr:CPBP family intramembrane metalloprotease [Parvularculaceae bacterium]
MHDKRAPEDAGQSRGENATFVLTFVFGLALIPVALLLGLLLGVEPASLFRFSAGAILSGVAATAPLIAMLFWFMRTERRSIVAFRRSQLEFFSNIGFRLTRPRIIALSMLAGVSEELLFRGVLQTAAMEKTPLVFAILAPSLLFGALHARTALYAAIAAGVGAYLGLLFWLTGSLVAPIIAHALYDYIAFDWTRRILDRDSGRSQSGRATSSGSSVVG